MREMQLPERIEELAANDPVVQNAHTLAEVSDWTYLQFLEECVIALSKSRNVFFNRCLDYERERKEL